MAASIYCPLTYYRGGAIQTSLSVWWEPVPSLFSLSNQEVASGYLLLLIHRCVLLFIIYAFPLHLFLYFNLVDLNVYVCGHAGTTALVWRSDHFQDHFSQVIRLGGKCFCMLNHFASFNGHFLNGYLRKFTLSHQLPGKNLADILYQLNFLFPTMFPFKHLNSIHIFPLISDLVIRNHQPPLSKHPLE